MEATAFLAKIDGTRMIPDMFGWAVRFYCKILQEIGPKTRFYALVRWGVWCRYKIKTNNYVYRCVYVIEKGKVYKLSNVVCELPLVGTAVRFTDSLKER